MPLKWTVKRCPDSGPSSSARSPVGQSASTGQERMALRSSLLEATSGTLMRRMVASMGRLKSLRSRFSRMGMADSATARAR